MGTAVATDTFREVLVVLLDAALRSRPHRTAYRDWSFAQAWLYREVRGTDPPAEM